MPVEYQKTGQEEWLATWQKWRTIILAIEEQARRKQ